MKSNKKLVSITLALLFFIAIVFSIYYFFTVIFKVEGEARPVEMNMPYETQNIKFVIEEVKMEKLKWKDALVINGWVFKENVKSVKRDAFLVLKSKNRSMVFKIEKDNIMRPDVSAAFHLDSGINNHGFGIYIPMYQLKENTYRIGFVIWDETGKYYTMSSKALKISNGAVKVNDYEFESDQVSTSIQIPTVKINCNFETISVSDNKLTISGWGVLQGMNTDSLKTYILLQKNEKVTVFSVAIKDRKDVTRVFKESGLNLDSSGFLAQIPFANLEKGRYQIGLYIVRGNHTGMTYSGKYIDVGN